VETTGKALVEHWDWAAGKGLMNSNTARVLRNACYQILSGVFPGEWEQLDLSRVNPDEIFTRFQNLRGKDLTPRSLQDYRRRLQQALDSYQSYVADPASWKGPGQDGSPRAESNSRKVGRLNTAKNSPGLREASKNDTDDRLIEYPFPIRDMTATVRLPRDLTIVEAKRLAGFIASLVMEPEEGAQ
jgi:hypothetical protein